MTACATAPIELADVKRNERIFDVATGTWALLQELARHVHVKHVVGIDGSPAMLSGARCHRIAAQFVVAVGRELPFPRASFDVVFVTYLLQLARPSERARMLEAISHVLRRGGRIVTVTVDTRSELERWFLSRLPLWTGLHPLDPRTNLRRAGLDPAQAQYTSTGWPSLVVLAGLVE